MSRKADLMAAGSSRRRERLRADMSGESVMTVVTQPEAAPEFEQVADDAGEATPTLTVIPDLPASSAETQDDQTTRQLDNTAEPAPPQKAPEGKWRIYAIGNTPRGRSTNIERINITVDDALDARIKHLDAQLAQEGSRHPISRNALLADAIDLIAKNPDKWQQAAESFPPGRRPLQGRVSPDRAATVVKLRYSETGRRNISGMLAAAVQHLLSE